MTELRVLLRIIVGRATLIVLSALCLGWAGADDRLGREREGAASFTTESVEVAATDDGAVDQWVRKGIEYANVDGHRLILNLHLPLESANMPAEGFPLVVWIHGGGWKSGSPNKCPVRWLADEGFAVASIGYRLSGQARFPAQVHDCKGAIRWLRANQQKYLYDSSRIVVAGSSAGGHLAALLGTSGGVAELEGVTGGNTDQSSRVDAVVDYYGATDFVLRSKTQPARANAKGSVVERLLGVGADQDTELAKRASAYYHITSDDPPMLVFHGTRDTTVLPDQSARIAEGYANAALPLSLHLIAGAGHGGDDFYKGENRNRLIRFLSHHLRDGR